MFPENIVKDKDNLFSGEREIGTRLEEFSKDHTNRYNFAKYFVRRGDVVLDAACGVGYGAHTLAEQAWRVDGIDYNEHAIQYARTHWGSDNIRYIRGNLLDRNVYPSGERYNVIVTFETIEHLKDDSAFLAAVSERLLPGGMFFVSAPNADVLKVEENPWHERHYTPQEFSGLLRKYFRYVFEFTQINCGVRTGRGGDNNILVCSHSPWSFKAVLIYRIYTFFYRMKKRLTG